MLPKLDVPSYIITLPLSKKEIEFRPFLVKEQRSLLMAMESNEVETIERAVRQSIINCTITKGIVIDELPIVDIEYYFLHLRARSVGEVVSNRYKCNNEIEDGKKCGNVMDLDINIMDIKVEEKEINSVIQLTDKITMKLQFPKFNLIKRAAASTSASQVSFDMVANCIEYIHDGEQYFYAKETPPEELIEFVEGLKNEQFELIEEFFNNIPKLKNESTLKCKKCGFVHTIEAEGLANFFV